MTRSHPGRPARINREMIEKAVIEVGFDRVSTTSVARHLGVEQSSLYRHINSRRGLLLAAISRVVDDTDFVIDHSSWREYLREIAERVWVMLNSHPGMAGVIFELDSPPPEQTSSLTATAVEVLIDYGFNPRQALLILETILDITCSSIHKLEHADEHMHNTPAGQWEPATGRQLDSNAFGAMRADHYQWWSDRIDITLDGAAAQLTR
ncbi:TetR/AcrR family transcriptional regulator [Corynebacterium mendelii]|uniref:TetR family transcriptional regulator n=1 Tax=Corynebacterium mendelii TaxID=2765362 RepID=A0A939E080_9CORY|nr:TetR family transcriptional regulator [Corynebacterium mendelii]MBN9644530.1 TetR family transcriptional regulator [Corynebacterium mendelii]